MRKKFPLWAALLVGAACLGVAPPAQAQPSLRPELRAQLEALDAEKSARTPTERKLSSRLLFAERAARGVPAAPGTAGIAHGIDADVEGRVLLDLRGEIGPGLIAQIERLGGEVVDGAPARGALRARVPLRQVRALAARPELRWLRPADRAFTRKLTTSQGDGAHYADDLRAGLGVDGSGVAVGVLSDGVGSLASLQASGDLPAVTVLPGQGGSGSEGTAMLEIVHDLAPGASLLFATAFGGQASFAENIVALRAAGADVIVDDVGYFAEAVFQDDDVAAAVDAVVADGALYFSAAGNSGNFDDGTAGVYEGDFVAGGTFRGKSAHDFGGGDIFNDITGDSPFFYTLQWSDPLGGSGNDYDLYLVDAAGTMVVALSNDAQNGDDDPYESVPSLGNDLGRKLVVVKHSGADRFLHLNAHRGRLQSASAGQIWGHPAARGALAVAAADARGRSSGFAGSEPVQLYSSDGPRRVFYESDGSPITPGDASASGGELRAVPHATGADCVATSTPGFAAFCGTSAAAPHLAAIAALLVEEGGGPGWLDPAAIRDALLGTALDIEAPGADRNSGAGIVHAANAGAALPECSDAAHCDDGLFCNGAEACVAGSCEPGTPPECSGETPLCDEERDVCAACLEAGDCDDGVFCDGAERCVTGSCEEGPPPACEGPTPFCDESQGACAGCLTDAHCDDAAFCNGEELCGGAGVCGPGPPPACANPTPACSELLDACVPCSADADCDDGLFCNGFESCQLGSCEDGSPPACSGRTPLCDEAGDACVECRDAADCDDGLFCTGTESCTDGICGAGAPRDCPVVAPHCDEAADACVACLFDANCDDGLFCNGLERCESGACEPEPEPVCDASTPVCDEASASCLECAVVADCPQPSGGCQNGVCVAPQAIPALGAGRGPAWLALGLVLTGLAALGRRARKSVKLA